MLTVNKMNDLESLTVGDWRLINAYTNKVRGLGKDTLLDLIKIFPSLTKLEIDTEYRVEEVLPQLKQASAQVSVIITELEKNKELGEQKLAMQHPSGNRPKLTIYNTKDIKNLIDSSREFVKNCDYLYNVSVQYCYLLAQTIKSVAVSKAISTSDIIANQGLREGVLKQIYPTKEMYLEWAGTMSSIEKHAYDLAFLILYSMVKLRKDAIKNKDEVEGIDKEIYSLKKSLPTRRALDAVFKKREEYQTETCQRLYPV